VLEYPEIDPIAFSLGPLSVRWYGLMYLLGFVAAWLLARSRSKRAHSPVALQQVDDLIFYAAVGVIAGGRIGYMLFYNLSALIDNPLSLFMFWQGGMSFHGGLIGVLVAMGLLAWRLGRRYFEVADFVAPLVPLGLGFGRVGNFINGELWGKPTDLPWGFVVNGVARHPSQLYEALLEGLALFAILWVFSARPRPTMAVSGLFLIGYGAFRCLVELVRLPDEHIGYLAFGWLTMGQVLTVPMVLAGAVLMWLAYRGARAGR